MPELQYGRCVKARAPLCSCKRARALLWKLFQIRSSYMGTVWEPRAFMRSCMRPRALISELYESSEIQYGSCMRPRAPILKLYSYVSQSANMYSGRPCSEEVGGLPTCLRPTISRVEDVPERKLVVWYRLYWSNFRAKPWERPGRPTESTILVRSPQINCHTVRYKICWLILAIAFWNHLAVKGTVAPVWVWLQVVWLERGKIGEDPLSDFKIFHSFFDF